MDLYSGLPYWIAKNSLYNYFNPLESDHTTDVTIIGTGITGALVAHELCEQGLRCTIIDKRSVGTGSSTASTALLQYEIDTPLSKLVEMMNEDLAVMAYESCLQSITDIEKVFHDIGYNPDYLRVPSVFYASDKKGAELIGKEYEIRKKHNLPVNYLDQKGLFNKYGIKAPGALENYASAQMDAYAGSTHLIKYHMKKNRLKVYTHTEVAGCNRTDEGYEVETARGNKINCKYVVIAAGFEAGTFLPEPVMKLTSTYAIISEPVHEKYLWAEKSLIWESAEPYIYIRTASKNRILMGGEDEDFKDPVMRDKLLRKKTETLEKKFKKLFPGIPFKTEMSWCGTFSTTEDGLPFIGSRVKDDPMFYALGYGGNGITFSMVAAQVIRNKIEGKEDKREKVFGFERLNR